ncbi:MAG: T9SS type A sorting domain-containing protein [Candidatus Kapabacteria bacterium]|nr:T9SS type A sorting domain-containing protein [Candidatus Kapabacteria bacterium]
MKTIFTLCLLLAVFASNFMLADDNNERQRTIDAFNRLKESAQPRPTKYRTVYPSYLLSQKSKVPLFLNVNATLDELLSDPNPMQNESSISVNPVNPKILIASAVDYRAESSTWVYVSSDGGITWKNFNLGKPYPTWRSSNDPSVMFDAEGIGYLVYGGFGSLESGDAGLVGENGVFIARTTDDGKNWEAHIPVIVHTGPQTLDSNFEDKYYVQVDNSPKSPYYRHVYIPWKRVTPRDSATQIVIAKSTDFASTWTKPLPISDRVSGSSEDTTFGQSFPLATTGPNGELYVVWNHGIVHGIGFVKSYDGGATFTEPRIIHNYNIFGETRFIPGQGYRHTVKGRVRAEAYPVIVCDNTEGERSGDLYLCWAADNPPNIYFSKSTDEGETWTEPVIVHEKNDNDQFWQWMSMDPKSGELAIMYLDSRNDPENIMIECYVSYSSDGGDTWIDRRVSDIVSDIRLNPFGSNAFAGDYSGNAFFDGIIYPSWVDMRGAVTNIRDSDVFTAIVNTRAPEAPSDFAYDFNPSEPTKVDLTWIPPAKKAFGQPLLPDDYDLNLYRDGELLATLPGGTDIYIDTALIPFKDYDYKIYAFRNEDKSPSMELTAYPGGSQKPDKPWITSVVRQNQDIKIEVKLPTLRTDSITPIYNLSKLKVYLDSAFIQSYLLTASDTGLVKTFEFTTAKPGFYILNVVVEDYFPQIELTTQSNFSERLLIYSGENHSDLNENFDTGPLPKYYLAGNWQKTNKFAFSQPFSFAISPDGHYKAEQHDTLIVFPIDLANNEDVYILFRHAAVIHRGDSAYVEIAPNLQSEWTIIGRYNQTYYEPWQNSILDHEDWKPESIHFENTDEWEQSFVRFRFISNKIYADEGWYVDNIEISNSPLSVRDNNDNKSIRVYPNPTSEFVVFDNVVSQAIQRVIIYNIYGEQLIEFEPTNHSAKIDLSTLSAGYYFADVESSGKIERVSFIVVK